MGSSLPFEFGWIMRQRPKQPFCRRIGSLFLRRLSIQYLFPNKPLVSAAMGVDSAWKTHYSNACVTIAPRDLLVARIVDTVNFEQ
jgi:hypothetical protein